MLFIIFQNPEFMSNQHEIKYMLGSLKLMHEKIGGPNTSIKSH